MEETCCELDLCDGHMLRCSVREVDVAWSNNQTRNANRRQLARITSEGNAAGSAVSACSVKNARCSGDSRFGRVGFEGNVDKHWSVHREAELWDDVGDAVQEILVMFENGLGVFSGQKASVDLDGTLVGHEIDLDAAVDDADVGGGGAEQGVWVLGEFACVGFDGLDDAGHHGDGVDAEMRFRAVGGTAVRVDFPA